MDMTNVLYGGMPARVAELEARMKRIAALARRIRTSGDAGQVDADALEIKRVASATAWCPRCGETVPPRKALWCDAPACPYDAEDHE